MVNMAWAWFGSGVSSRSEPPYSTHRAVDSVRASGNATRSACASRITLSMPRRTAAARASPACLSRHMFLHRGRVAISDGAYCASRYPRRIFMRRRHQAESGESRGVSCGSGSSSARTIIARATACLHCAPALFAHQPAARGGLRAASAAAWQRRAEERQRWRPHESGGIGSSHLQL